MRRSLMIRFYAAFGRLPRGWRRRIVRLFSPTYTVGAVCFVFRDDGRVLLVRHSYNPRWGTPGGLAKRGESPHLAAVREAREEVGLEVQLVSEPALVVEPALRRVDVAFRARLSPGSDADAARPTSAEILEARWFAPDALPELSTETALAWGVLTRQGHADDPRTERPDGRGRR